VIKNLKIDRAFTGIQGQIKTLIDRNISQENSVLGNFEDEESFRCFCDDLFDAAIKLNPIKELSILQIYLMKDNYLNQVFLYLDQKLEQEERQNR